MTADHQQKPFDHEAMLKDMAAYPSKAPCCYVCPTEVYHRLKSDLKITSTTDPIGFLGMKIYAKEGQKAMCWMIENQRLAAAYLEGKITESDLELIVKRQQEAVSVAG